MTPKYRAGPDPGKGKAVVESFKFKNRVYELRLNACGKKNCSTCQGNIPRHGPYWYLCIPWGGKWRRIYIGKELDTTKFIGPNGKIDMDKMVKAPRRPMASLSPRNEPHNPDSTTEPRGPHQLYLLENDKENPDESLEQSTYQPRDARPDLTQNPDDDPI